MANGIIVNTNQDSDKRSPEDMRDTQLASWITGHVDTWTQHRDDEWKDRWDEYYRLYRGRFISGDSNRKSERSRLISPALQQAVETAVAEVEEATFGKGDWFEIDGTTESLQDVSQQTSIRLAEDLNKVKAEGEISKAYLHAALYGTGIAKLHIEEELVRSIASEDGAPIVREDVKRMVSVEAIDPRDFAIDTSATTIDEALGVSHTIYMPQHSVTEKQDSGEYKSGDVGTTEEKPSGAGRAEPSFAQDDDVVKVVEYHGLVPAELLPLELEDDEVEVALFEPEEGESSALPFDDTNLVEAIVVVANGSTILKAVRNELLMQDRGFVSFQYDTVPNRFWGRGVAEKGYNMQKALDAELRARIDAMALAAHPMIGVDATQLPRGANLTASAGKVWLSNGDPSRTFVPLQFGNTNPATFSQSGELERMLSMATGTMDGAAPVGVSPRNATASGMSMMQGGFIKRSKRTMQNITRDFLEPLLSKVLWRYMEFQPDRYSAGDFSFRAIAGIGIMAREIESNQMVTLMSVLPQGSPVQLMLMKGVVDSTSLDIKDELLAMIDQMAQPDPQQQQLQQLDTQLTIQERIKELEKTDSEIFENVATGQSKLANTQVSAAGVSVQQQNADTQQFKTQLEALLKKNL